MTLAHRIDQREAVIGVIGLGYVGLPLVRTFRQAGFDVIGFDNDPVKIDKLCRGENYLPHLGDDLVASLSRRDRAGRGFDPTLDFDRLCEPDAIVICVPTPLGAHQEPDMSYVQHTVAHIARSLRPHQLVVLESTTYPRTTREEVLPLLEAGGLRCGHDFFLAYSPEREDPGRKDHTTQTIPKLVGGINNASRDMAVRLYRTAIDRVIPVDSAEIAEAAKLLENIYRAVNIAMVNEMKLVLSAMGIDIWKVVEAAATKPFGFAPFYPGPGLGGHCIPVDPFYLTWKARKVGQPTRFIELAGQVNQAMPGHVVQTTALALNDQGIAIRGANVLVLGLAYKPDVDDGRESPSLVIIEKLQAAGANVQYNDPHVPATHKMRHHDLKMRSTPLTGNTLSQTDCVLIATHHSAYDWQMIMDHASLVVDTRNAMHGVTGKAHVVRA